MKLIHAVAAILLLAGPLAACGDSKPAAPAPTEARVEQSRLKEFVPLFPAPLAGWTVGEPKFVTGDDKSAVSRGYATTAGDSFAIEIAFSNAEAAKFQELVDDDKKRARAGVDKAEFNGQVALNFNNHALTPAQYLAVVSPSRTVSITPIAGEMTKPIIRATFEKIDFDGIAAK